ncbi:MAG: hypothetical protein Tsb0013_15860 [Phycisphaerales bacterium]
MPARSRLRTAVAACVCLTALLTSAGTSHAAAPQGSSFTYQGLLSQSGMNVSDPTDLRFTLWDASAGGAVVGTPIVQTVTPDDGVFSVDLDFGLVPFTTGEARWLEIEASPAGMGVYESLGRTPLSATTYSLSTRGIDVTPDNLVLFNGLGLRTNMTTFGGAFNIYDFAPDSDGQLLGEFVGNGAGPQLRFTGVASSFVDIGQDDLGSFVVQTDDTLRFAVAQDGNVGIGTDVPLTQLHLDSVGFLYDTDAIASNTNFTITNTDPIIDLIGNDTGSVGAGLNFKEVDASTGLLGQNWSFIVTTPGSGSGFELRNGTNPAAFSNATVMSFKPSGFVGVNTSNPASQLDVRFDSAASNGVEVTASGTNPAIGLHAIVENGTGVRGEATGAGGANYGVYGLSSSPSGWGVFSAGRLGAAGTKSFCIDHPLAPEDWYLMHYSMEAPEPLNRYSGNVILDANGVGLVQLPDYFGAINTDFRYTLTAIGAPAPNLHIAREVEGNVFAIAGGQPGMKVSWEVTARRNDAFVRQMGAPVEVQKAQQDRGRYLMPELYDAGPDKRINR